MTAPDPIRAEDGREADCASEWRQIERAWRDADLPEWFLGNGGTNHGLYRFVDKVRALRSARAEAEVARLTAALNLLLPFVDHAAGQGLLFFIGSGEPDMDAADLCMAAARELGIECGGDEYDAILAAGKAARAALHGGDQ